MLSDPAKMEAKLCECGCGNPAPIAKRNDTLNGYVKGQPKRFINGHSRGHKTHGMEGSPEYFAYHDAKRRCTNSNSTHWKDYGGRGIQFRFTSFEQFFAELGPRPAGLTLDRINNDGHYEPSNVRWATSKEQRANQRPQKKAA